MNQKYFKILMVEEDGSTKAFVVDYNRDRNEIEEVKKRSKKYEMFGLEGMVAWR